jgi:hypothetical protein
VSLYLDNGVKEVWLMHPEQRMLVRFTQGKRAGVKGLVALPLRRLIGKIALAEIFEMSGLSGGTRFPFPTGR